MVAPKSRLKGDRAVVMAPGLKKEEIRPALVFLLLSHFNHKIQWPHLQLFAECVFLMRTGFISCFIVPGIS